MASVARLPVEILNAGCVIPAGNPRKQTQVDPGLLHRDNAC